MSPARRAVVAADIFVRLSDVKSTAEKIMVMTRILEQLEKEMYAEAMSATNHARDASMEMLRQAMPGLVP